LASPAALPRITTPGDDAIPPRWLLESARESVKLRRLAKLVRGAGGTLELTPDVLAQIVELSHADVQCLGNAALGDFLEGDPDPMGFGADAAALVLVVGVLLYEQAHPKEKPPRKRARPADESLARIGAAIDEINAKKG
jgi:hypothetical protein